MLENTFQVVREFIKSGDVIMYTIYHVIGKKVGCTVNFEKRKTQYPDGTQVEILEELDSSVGDQIAGDREHYWADHFGYKKYSHYSKSNWNLRQTMEQKSQAGKKAGELGVSGFQTMTFEQRSQIGKRTAELGKSGFQNLTSEQRSEIAKKTAALGLTGYATLPPEKRRVGGRRGGKISSALPTNAFRTGVAARASAASPNSVSNKISECPYCGTSIRGPSFYRHKKACERKNNAGK
jgi:hypothetical protein